MIDDSEARDSAASREVQVWDKAAGTVGDAYREIVSQVSRFTAHALGNPLAGLSLTLDLLATTTNPADVQRLVLRCQRIAQRLTDFKENLGALGGSLNCPIANIELEPFLADWQSTQNLGGAYAMPVQIEPAARYLRCNANLLANALNCLFRNACDANPEGGTIGLIATRLSGATRLTVWDDGPGMPAELVTKIFNEPVSTKKHGGGLGLLIVSMIVEQVHGGRAQYAPRSPHGCQFHLDFSDEPERLS